MQRNRTIGLIAVSATLSALGGCADAEPSSSDEKSGLESGLTSLSADALSLSPYDSASNAVLAGIASPENPLVGSGDWPSAGHDWAHTGWNTKETAIGPANVASIHRIWNFAYAPPGGTPIPTIGTAVTSGNTAFIADTGGFLHSVNLQTGVRSWTKWASTATPDPIYGATIQGAPVVTSDAIYVGDSTAAITRLERTAPATPDPDFGNPYASPPVPPNPRRDVTWTRDVDTDPGALVQGDLATYTDLSSGKKYVVFGVSSFDNAITPSGDLTHRGSVAGVDAQSGALGFQLWTTSDQTLPRPKFGAGVGVWSSPAIDPIFGIYIGTGQFYEFGSTNPSPASAADVDLSDSILRLNPYAIGGLGKLLAHKQFTSGDVYGLQHPEGHDWDVGTPPNLFPPQLINGKIVLPIGVGTKEGNYNVLDRTTFAPIWSTKVSQASRIGGFQATGAFAKVTLAGVKTDVVFVAAHELIDGRSIDDIIPNGESVTWLNTLPGIVAQQQNCRTNIKALKVKTGEVVWQTTVVGPVTYAPLIVANGLLYHGAANGSIRAFDVATGTLLGGSQLGGDPSQGFAFGNIITAMSIAQGRLLVSSSPLAPYPDGSNLGVVAYGVQ